MTDERERLREILARHDVELKTGGDGKEVIATYDALALVEAIEEFFGDE